MATAAPYPVQLSVDYPDHPLDRLTTLLRVFFVIPIAIVLGAVTGASGQTSHRGGIALAAGGLLFLGPLLMIVFRQKYPRWWFDWNRELLRFSNRVTAYLALMSDRYPSTDEEQSVHVELPYPDARQELNRWLPLVKWLLAIPHFIVLACLMIAAFFAVLAAWVAILASSTYPRGLFEFVEGVIRYGDRVVAYAVILTTDEYPPFRLGA